MPASGATASFLDRYGVDVVALFLLALAVRLVFLDHTPHMDELYHVLAGRSLLEDGTLRVAGGDEYRRAWLFTYVVAGAMRWFGDDLVAARIPAMLAGSSMVPLLYVWLRSNVGRGAAWIGATLLCFNPEAIYLSQLTRFYTLHALAFLLCAMAVWRILRVPDGWRSVVPWIVATGCFLLALHLQITTLIGAAAIGVAAGALLLPALSALARRTRTGAVVLIAGVVIVAFAAAGVLASGFGQRLLTMYAFSDLWARDSASLFQFYHYHLLTSYPVLWLTFPMLCLVGVLRAPRFVVFCTVAFAVILLVHSSAAWKSARYVFYGMPLFFAVVAAGAAPVITRLPGLAERALRPFGADRVGPSALRVLATSLAALAVAFAVAVSGAVPLSWKMLTVPDAEWRYEIQYRGESDWAAAAAALGPAIDAADIVVSSTDLKPIYYMDRLDVVLSVTELGPQADVPGADFAYTTVSGRPVISTVESMAHVMECAPTGLVIVERAHWRNPWGVTPAVADLIESLAEPIPLADGWWLSAFRWSRTGSETPAHCATDPRWTALAGTSRP